MIQLYSYKFRIYPNKEQIVLINKHFGSSRFVYNYLLANRIKIYKETKKSLHFFDDSKIVTQLRKEYKWLKEVSAQSLQYSAKSLHRTYNKFFQNIKNNKKGKKGFPKFQKKYQKQSFHIQQDIKIINNTLKIPKFKTKIKIVTDRNIEGIIKFATISKNKSNQYFISVTVEKEIKSLPKNGNQMGIDCNVNEMVCLQNNTEFIKFNNPLPERKYRDKLKLLAQSVSRKQKGSKSRAKAQLKLNKLKQYCKNIREDFQHKLSKKIINENQVIIIENLYLEGLLSSTKNKSKKAEKEKRKLLRDSSFGSFIYKLKYKCKWYNKELIVIDRFFPSSKLCSVCEYKNEDLKGEKDWQCPNCQTCHNRDENAAVNILNEGLRTRTAGIAGIADCPINSDKSELLVESEVLQKFL